MIGPQKPALFWGPLQDMRPLVLNLFERRVISVILRRQNTLAVLHYSQLRLELFGFGQEQRK